MAPTRVPTLVPGEVAKLFDSLQFLSVLMENNRLVQVPDGSAWFIAVNHRGFGANADIHLDGGTQLQLTSVTDARFQFRLLEGSRIFVQSGPYPNGAEIELAGLPVVTTVRGCLGTEYTGQSMLTVLCLQGACTLSTDFGVSSQAIAAGQSVAIDVSRLKANAPRPILQANAEPYWNLLQHTSAGRDDARLCHVPPPPAPTATTQSGRLPPGPAPVTNTPVPPTNTPVPPTNTPVPPTDTAVPPTNTPAPPPNTPVPPTP